MPSVWWSAVSVRKYITVWLTDDDFSVTDWWWRKTRRRKRRRPQDTSGGGGRYQTRGVASENRVDGNDNINVDDRGVDGETQDNNNNNGNRRNRFVLKTVVVT